MNQYKDDEMKNKRKKMFKKGRIFYLFEPTCMNIKSRLQLNLDNTEMYQIGAKEQVSTSRVYR